MISIYFKSINKMELFDRRSWLDLRAPYPRGSDLPHTRHERDVGWKNIPRGNDPHARQTLATIISLRSIIHINLHHFITHAPWPWPWPRRYAPLLDVWF